MTVASRVLRSTRLRRRLMFVRSDTTLCRPTPGVVGARACDSETPRPGHDPSFGSFHQDWETWNTSEYSRGLWDLGGNSIGALGRRHRNCTSSLEQQPKRGPPVRSTTVLSIFGQSGTCCGGGSSMACVFDGADNATDFVDLCRLYCWSQTP